MKGFIQNLIKNLSESQQPALFLTSLDLQILNNKQIVSKIHFDFDQFPEKKPETDL